jgi:superfamily II DNA/RNA helicase
MDVAIQSETGSGKTLAFLAPTLARMRYPPDVFPDDLKGPQARKGRAGGGARSLRRARTWRGTGTSPCLT